MKRFGKYVGIVFAFCIVLFGIYIVYVTKDISIQNDQSTSFDSILPKLPADALYNIEGEEVRFKDGKGVYGVHETQAYMVGEPVYGDMNSDGRDDAAIIIVLAENTLPQKYYIALALQDEDGYLGLNALLLPDNLAPERVHIQDEVLVVTHPLSSDQTEINNHTKGEVYEYFILTGITLQRALLKDSDVVTRGELIYEGEDMTLTLCNNRETYRISSNSRAFAALEAIYLERTRYTEEEQKDGVYVVVAGESSVDTEDDFEEEKEDLAFHSVFVVGTVLSAPQKSTCPETESQSEIIDMVVGEGIVSSSTDVNEE